MRRAEPILLSALALLASSTAAADVYIREINRTDSYVLGFRTGTEKQPPSELWMGETAIAYHTPGRTFIVDLEARTFTFVNTEARTYVESSLPVDLSAILSDDLLERYRVWHRTGQVTETGDTEEILGKTAREYRLDLWEVDHGETSNERSVRVWATTDVDFDWRRLDDLLGPFRIILNRDATLREELQEIEGAQLRVEWWTGWFGKGQKHRTEVVEIALDRDPPKGVYAPPEGFERKERLTRQDL